jgi:hypothetical protein
MSVELLEPPPQKVQPRAPSRHVIRAGLPVAPGEQRAYRLAFAASALLHILLLLFVFGRMEFGERDPLQDWEELLPVAGTPILPFIIAEGTPVESPEALRTVPAPPEVVLPRPEPAVPRPAAPEPTAPTVTPPVATGTTGGTGVSEGGREAGASPTTGGRVPTIEERLSPRLGDPRIFARTPVNPLSRPLTAEEAARARWTAAIDAVADSMMTEAERAARALDWTVKEKDGDRWGVSPGKLHLGKVTLPLPMLGASASMRERMSDWSAIQQQALRADGKVILDDRIKAIRARRDAERDSLRRKSGGN